MRIRTLIATWLLAGLLTPVGAAAQQLSSAVTAPYRVVPDVTYLTASGIDQQLDVYMRTDVDAGPFPTLIWIHGGGWVGGSKDTQVFDLLPYLETGWNVVNVEYRLARVALAPAAVEDCLCALRWIIRNAEDYDIDTSRLVVSGASAGGHLALTTGLTPASAGLDRRCPGSEPLRVAAIVNWYGITDVVDLLDGPNMKNYAVQWLGSLTDRVAVARRVSPLSYVRAGVPPVISVHGDADPVVPYAHAVRLHEALKKAGVREQLVTVPRGSHGGFGRDANERAFDQIRPFLAAAVGSH